MHWLFHRLRFYRGEEGKGLGSRVWYGSSNKSTWVKVGERSWFHLNVKAKSTCLMLQVTGPQHLTFTKGFVCLNVTLKNFNPALVAMFLQKYYN